MALNFAPYSEPPPSPPTRWAPPSTSYQSGAPISSLGSTSFSSNPYTTSNPYASGGSGMEFSWLRHDWAGALAYAGPFGALACLLLETQNDFVRFQAWQSALLCAALLVLHVLFLPLGATMEWLLLGGDMVLLGFMSLRAYRDSDLLDRYHLPFMGGLAQRWVEEE